MTIAPVNSGTFPFADGNTGHSCNLGSAPSVGDLDVLCINSDTTVNTAALISAGWSLRRSDVTNQGAYILSRKAVGGEGSTVTVTTSGNFNTVVSWSRWSGTNAFDVSAGTQVNTSLGSQTPSHSTGAMAETGELVIAFAAVHATQLANQAVTAWTGGITQLTEGRQGSGNSGVYAQVGYALNAGTAALSPQANWSGDTCQDRYMLTATFTAAAGGTTFPVTLAATAVASGTSLSVHAVRRVTLNPVNVVSGTSLVPTGSAVAYVRRGGSTTLAAGLAGAVKRGGVTYTFGS